MTDDRSSALVPQGPTSLAPVSRLAERTLAERVEREEGALVAARTLVVGPGGYATITEAMAVARDGDTVVMRPGIYRQPAPPRGESWVQTGPLFPELGEPEPWSAFRFVDLLAGIGGIRIGLEAARGRCVYAMEIDRYAARTYEANFGKVVEGDVRIIDAAYLPRHDVLAASIPFGRWGFGDPKRGRLFFEILRLVDQTRPPIVFLESAKHLIRHHGGTSFQTIRDAIEDLGYTFGWQLIAAPPWVPKHGVRAFLVCLHRDAFGDEPFEFPDVARALASRCHEDGYEIVVSRGGSTPRRLTPLESAHLLGYPDDFAIPVSDAQAYRLLGNSPFIPLIEILAAALVERISREEEAAAEEEAGEEGEEGDSSDSLLIDRAPLSLGIEGADGTMIWLIDRNTRIPARMSLTVSTRVDHQERMELHVLQGERDLAADNRTLGKFVVEGITPAPHGVPQIEVSLDIDANGIVEVRSRDRATGKQQKVTITSSSMLDKNEVDRIVSEAEALGTPSRVPKDVGRRVGRDFVVR